MELGLSDPEQQADSGRNIGHARIDQRVLVGIDRAYKVVGSEMKIADCLILARAMWRREHS